MDRTSGAYLYALATETALGVVNVGEVIADRDGVKLALLETLTTADAGVGADLLIDRSLILIDAGDEDAPIFLSFLPQLDDVAGAGLDALTAGGTLILIDLGETGGGIHMDGIEVADAHAVATSETAVCAERLATIE